MATALITGITGQDGSYLAEYLLDLGYSVHGLVRPSSTVTTGRIAHLLDRRRWGQESVTLHNGDMTDGDGLARLIRTVKPDEVYNLAAQSHVGLSFSQPEYTSSVVGLGVTRLLEAIRGADSKARLYQAGSSEMFGDSPPPQSESSPMRPLSPYAAAKLYAAWMVSTYRRAYGMHAVTGILFNHESPRRGEGFVTRKVTQGVARIVAGTQDELVLGNLEARRDWGHARDYVVAMHAMLQTSEPEDLVIGTGETHSVAQLADTAFSLVGLDWRRFVRSDEQQHRPIDVPFLHADASRARERLGWEPTTTFRELITEMLECDLVLEGLDLDSARALAEQVEQRRDTVMNAVEE